MAKRVLPQPAPPATRVGLPLGRPPPVISSMPGIPVGYLGRGCARLFCFAGVTKNLLQNAQELSIMDKVYLSRVADDGAMSNYACCRSIGFSSGFCVDYIR